MVTNMTATTISNTRAGTAGALAAAVTLALTELIAGITDKVPSAVAA